jgi:hypothetical protein
VNEHNGTTYDETTSEGSSSEGKSSEEIRAEIDRKRSEMTEKIDTIQDRLSPDNLKQQAQTMVQDIMQESTDAIIEFARTGSKQAGRTLVETIKANPLPSAVIGVGLGWLAMNMMKSQGGSDSDRYGYQGTGYQGTYGSMYDRRQMDYGANYDPGYAGSYTGGRSMGQGARVPYTGAASYSGEYGYEEQWQNNPDAYRDTMYQREGEGVGDKLGKVGEAAKGAVGKVGETAQNIAGSVADAAQTAAGAVTGAAGTVAGAAQGAAGKVGGVAQGAAGAAGRAGEGAGSMAESAMHAGQQARHQAMQAGRMAADQAGSLANQGQYQAGRMGRTVQRSLEDNPIAFGVAALLAGVAIGLALPATRQERQLLGDAHDQFMDKAQEVATNVTESAKQVANEVQPRLQETAQRVADDLKMSGMQVTEDLKQTGKEALDETKETLKDAGKSAKSKVTGSGAGAGMQEEQTEIVSGLVVEEDESQPQPNTGGSYDKKFDAQI